MTASTASVVSASPKLHPIGEALGTEVRGVDLARDDDQVTADWITVALVDRGVLFFRNQSLTAAQLARPGKQLGWIETHIFAQYRDAKLPEVSHVTNRDADGNIDPFDVTRASKWHFDETYQEHLPQLTVLRALQVPKVKGGTKFADMRAAYDALESPLREKVENVIPVFRGRPPGGRSGHRPPFDRPQPWSSDLSWSGRTARQRQIIKVGHG